MRKITNILLLFVVTLASVCGCSKEKESAAKTDYTAQWTRYYANIFAYQCLKTYYLWVDEVADAMDGWMTNEEPIAKVKSVRYKDESGKDIDRWTMLTDDIASVQGTVSGVSTTYGADVCLYYYDQAKTTVCMVVRYCSAGSPAEKAGLKRGDVVTKINGKAIPADGWEDLVYDQFFYASSCTLGMNDGREVSLKAVEMYEEPVYLWKTFDCGGKKVGYLIYNRFTLDSCEKLIEACSALKAEGITELILDMRYNPGGYVYAEYTLASMLAPAADVENNSVFELSVYNKTLSEAFGEKQILFESSYKFSSGGKSYEFDTKEANLGITKIYAILTGGSASASESLLVGLGPYVDIEIIGEQSSGKYCTGILYPATSWFDDYKDNLKLTDYTNGKKYLANWGMYVMISRYADKNGETPCMPDGFTPDIESSDNPTEEWQLGDEREAMLRVALERAGKTDLAPVVVSQQRRKATAPLSEGPALKNNGLLGTRIILPEQM